MRSTLTALDINLWVLAGICFATWFASVVTKDYSFVDRIWSLIPIVYAWVFAGGEGFTNPRLNLMAALITLWGARLTFNFARKGGYAPGGEDYRWPVLRARMSPLVYQIFNVFFIVIFQNALLLAITMPMLAAGSVELPLVSADYIFAALFLAFLVLETIADQQQWNFHQHKKAERAAGREPKQGFLTTGLFSISRHPNFFSEQAQWWVLFLWVLALAGNGAIWFGAGALVLSALFAGSTKFTEELSIQKYPEYREYQKRVSAVIPWFPSKG